MGRSFCFAVEHEVWSTRIIRPTVNRRARSGSPLKRA